jgi:predicted Rossmann-fold nucleotide-binding protein
VIYGVLPSRPTIIIIIKIKQKRWYKISINKLIEKVEKKVINEDYGDLLILISKLKKEFDKIERFIKFAREKLKNNKKINLEELQIADLKKLKINIINELHSRGTIA